MLEVDIYSGYPHNYLYTSWYTNFYNINNFAFFLKIKEVKDKIHKEKGDDYKIELQKLILLGKVLEDSKSVGEYNITETSSIVCFASKVEIFFFFKKKN